MTTVLVHKSLQSIDSIPPSRRIYVPMVARWAEYGTHLGVTAITGSGDCGIYNVVRGTFVKCDNLTLRDDEHALFASSIIDTIVRTDLDTHKSCATYRLMLILYSTGWFEPLENGNRTSLSEMFRSVFPLHVLQCIMNARGVVDGEGMEPIVSLLFVDETPD